jgi:hypothetical protein
MSKTALLAASVIGVAFAAPASAATTIDFESETPGTVAQGTNIGGITFTTANGDGLQIGDFGSQGDGLSLAVFSDSDGNFLQGALDLAASAISFEFGNDDPRFTNIGDLATLEVFFGASLIDTVTVSLNRDDLMNQTISYSGGTFDNFTFAYTDAAGAPFTGGGTAATGLIEIVDNFQVGGAVPEPSTWAMLLLGFFGIGGALRRRRSVTTTVSYA